MKVIYKLDNVDLTDYGVHVSASEGLLSRPRPKKPTTLSWQDYNGEVVDLSKRTYEPREIELDCFIKAASQWEFQDKVNAFLSVLDTAGAKRLSVGVSGLEGGENLLINSQSPLWQHNTLDTYMTSVLMADEAEPYRRNTPTSGERVTCFNEGSGLYQFNDPNCTYYVGLDVRLNGPESGSGKASIYIHTDFDDSVLITLNVPYNQWFRVYSEGFTLPMSDSPDNKGYIILNNDSDDRIDRYVDIKNVKIEKNAKTQWTPAPADLKPLVFEVYSSEGIDIKKTWNERSMVGTFKLKLTEPEPIKRVIKHVVDNVVLKPSSWVSLGNFTANEYEISCMLNYYNNSRSNVFKLALGESYVLSFDCEEITGPFRAEIYSTTNVENKYTDIVLGKNSLVFTGTSGMNLDACEVRFYGINETTSTLLKVKNIKIEKGLVATEWTLPSLQASITVTSSKLLNIYWGDGSQTYDVSGTAQTITHNYSTNETYFIVVTGNIDEITSLTTTGTIVWNKL